MTTIKARPSSVRKKTTIREKVTEARFVTLHRYAKCIGEDVPYVLDELIGTLEDDKAFQHWLKAPENAEWEPEWPATAGRKKARKPAGVSRPASVAARA